MPTVQILDRCTVVTVNPERRVIPDGAVAWDDSGAICSVGPSDEIRAAHPDADAIDAEGRVAFPGFVNVHTHTVLTMLRGLAEDLGPHSLYGQMYPMKSILTPEDRYTMGMLGCVEALRFGTTTITENYEGSTDVAPAIEQLGMRGVISEIVNDAVMTDIRQGEYRFSEEQADRQLQRSLDQIESWHGAASGRIICQVSAHAPDTCSRGLLERLVEISDQRGLGRHIHLAQTPKEVSQVELLQGMRSAELLDATGYLSPRTIAAHCIHIQPHEIEMIGRSGTTVAHCAVINGKRGKAAPIMGLEAVGANIALGSDNMSEDMVDVTRHAMYANRVREDIGTLPSSHDVIEWLTINGARAVGLADQIGSLEPGKQADITVVDFRKPHLAPVFDPVANFAHNAIGADVEMVFVGGRQLVGDGDVLTIDSGDVVQEAQERAEHFWRRFEDRFGGTVMAER
ncbi:amidohydrolase family protein [soil metagenome]